jgi:hypothetical protein
MYTECRKCRYTDRWICRSYTSASLFSNSPSYLARPCIFNSPPKGFPIASYSTIPWSTRPLSCRPQTPMSVINNSTLLYNLRRRKASASSDQQIKYPHVGKSAATVNNDVLPSPHIHVAQLQSRHSWKSNTKSYYCLRGSAVLPRVRRQRTL